MKTSNFVRAKGLQNQVAISSSVPYWWKGREYKKLAPRKEMLKMSAEEYDREYDKILCALDPKKVLEELGHDAVLLCWESPGVKCHRRRVAEWLEKGCGIEITEYSFKREDVLAYTDMPEKEIKVKTKREEQPLLF